MDYYNRYIKCKFDYFTLQNGYNHNLIGGKTNNKCTIDDSDKVLFGDGGSTSIIVIIMPSEDLIQNQIV